MNDNKIYVVIPAYEPTTALIQLCETLKHVGIDTVIVVDDGSGDHYADIFHTVENELDCIVLRHAVNLGKGRALKTAFNYILVKDPSLIGVVTADSDGQHTPTDILNVINTLQRFPKHLIMGCRNFHDATVPWKSYMGNLLTRRFCSFLCGVTVSDTQTGLRGIPSSFIKRLLSTPGERFDYETNMLLECNENISIHEVPIETIYESKTNHKTHFDPLIDSIMIYKVILTYSLSSIASTIIDFIIFAILTGMHVDIWRATAIGRLSAAFINFILNRNIVFHSSGKIYLQLFQYLVLVALSGTASASLITVLQQFLSLDVTVIKAMVEIVLFFFNYYIQRTFIFQRKRGRL